MRRGAIFDLDGTLVQGTSTERLFLPWLRARGVLGLRQWMPFLSRAMWLPIVGRTRSVRRNKWYLHDLGVEEIRGLVPEFVSEVLMHRFCALTVRRLEGLLAEGRPVCLLTGAPDFLAQAMAGHFHLTEGLGTRLEIRDGRFTGRLAGPHFFGERKRDGVQELARRHGIDLASSIGFADQESDIPFLECFGEAVAVDPHPGLLRHAERRGWEVVRCAG